MTAQDLDRIELGHGLGEILDRLRGMRDGKVSSAELEDVCASLSLIVIGLRCPVSDGPAAPRVRDGKMLAAGDHSFDDDAEEVVL